MSLSSIKVSDLTRVITGLFSDTKPATSVNAGNKFLETDTANGFLFSGDDWYQTSVAGAANVHISSSDLAALNNLSCSEITENIYSDTVVGSRVTEGGLEVFSYFQLQVVGALAAEDLSVSISLDGVNFVTIPVINMATGAELAAGTNIEAAGMYRYGNEPTSTSLRDAPTRLGIKSIKITRETATASAQVDVIMRAA